MSALSAAASDEDAATTGQVQSGLPAFGTVGGTANAITLVLALVYFAARDLSYSGHNMDDDEFLEILRVPFAEALAMVGDGLNDGPVLAGADVSFALGQAVPLAQSKSDFVLMGGQLDVLVSTVLRSRQTMRIVRQNLWWSAAYNAACVPLALMGWLPAWAAGLGMALSSLLVVLNALRLAQALPEVTPAPALILQAA